MEIGIVIVMLVALIAYGIIAASQGDGEITGVASTIDELPTQINLMGASHWQITILRKSGYLHDVREIFGDANTGPLTAQCSVGWSRPIVIGLPPDPEVGKLFGTDGINLHRSEELHCIGLDPIDGRIPRSTLPSMPHRGDVLLPFLEHLLEGPRLDRST